MKSIVAKGLKAQFKQLQDVKFVTLDPDKGVVFRSHHADMVIKTWLGGRVYVYIMDKAPKSRDVKNTVKDNSRHSIGSLFLVHKDELPTHGEAVRLHDWLESLYLLNDGVIYGYTVHDNRLEILQLSFTETPIGKVYHCWHQSEFQIESLSIRKRSVQGNIRGTWSVADIASPRYKRQVNFDRQKHKFHYQTKRTEEVTAVPADELRASYALLGLERGASENAVKTAYRKFAMQLHPDVSAFPASEAERRFRQLNEAYEIIKTYHNWT